MSQEQTKRAKYWYIFGRHLSTTWSPAIFVASYIYICTMQGILIHTYFQMLCNSGIEPCDHKFPFWTKCWFYNGGSLRNQQSNQCLNTPHPKLMNPQILSFNSKTAGRDCFVALVPLPSYYNYISGFLPPKLYINMYYSVYSSYSNSIYCKILKNVIIVNWNSWH